MKKILIAILMMGFLTPVCNADGPFPLLSFNIAISGDDYGNDGDTPGPRDTIEYPTVAINGYSLYLYNGCDNSTLRLVSSDETIVFSTFIEEGTLSVVLPSNLTGEYELQFICGDITFYCDIEL